jgi:hypothetical protein
VHQLVEVVFAVMTTLEKVSERKSHAVSYSSIAKMAWFIAFPDRGKEPVAVLPPLERLVDHVPLPPSLFEKAMFALAPTLKPLPQGRLGFEQHQPEPIHHVPLRPSRTCWRTPVPSDGCKPGQR